MSIFRSLFSSTTKPTEPNPVPCEVPTIEQLNDNTMYSQINSLDELCTLQKYEHFFIYYPNTQIIRCNFFNKKESINTYSFFNRESNGNPESRMMTSQFNHDYRYYKKATITPAEEIIPKGGRRRKIRSKKRSAKRRKTRRRM